MSSSDDYVPSSDFHTTIDIKPEHISETEDHLTTPDAKKAIKKFSCELCDFVTDRRVLWGNHFVEDHGDGRKLICELCSFETDLQQKMIIHRKKRHTDCDPFVCFKCEHYSTKYLNNYFEHLHTHIGGKPFKCEICNFRTHRYSIYEKHSKEHTSENRSSKYKCSNCDCNPGYRRLLLLHMQEYHGVQLYECEECSFLTLKKTSLVYHIKRQHLGNFRCRECARMFTNAKFLTVHISRTHKVRQERANWHVAKKDDRVQYPTNPKLSQPRRLKSSEISSATGKSNDAEPHKQPLMKSIVQDEPDVESDASDAGVMYL